MTDLVLLVPDKNTESTVHGALARPEALGIRAVSYQVLVDQGRDGGVRRRGAQLLAAQHRRFSHALLLLDYEGCGADVAASELEAYLDGELAATWADRAKAIVIDPEVDVWMWGTEAHLRQMVGWALDVDPREWLAGQSFVIHAGGKPARPKEALDAVFRHARMPRSSARYRYMAERTSLTRCLDPAFVRLRTTMGRWFGPQNS